MTRPPSRSPSRPGKARISPPMTPDPAPATDADTSGAEPPAPACVMCFNASDPSGAGGLAGDVATVAAMGAHALPVVTSIVAPRATDTQSAGCGAEGAPCSSGTCCGDLTCVVPGAGPSGSLHAAVLDSGARWLRPAHPARTDPSSAGARRSSAGRLARGGASGLVSTGR